MRFIKKQIVIAMVMAGVVTVAQAFQVGEGKPVVAHIAKNQTAGFSVASKQDVYLMRMSLTDDEMNKIVSYQDHSVRSLYSADSPTQALQDMSVPVLNQGRHGTCATFANYAAIDAVLNKGDYASQLCSLELGSYLNKVAWLGSGWDGSTGPVVLEQVLRFGLVSKRNQQAHSCAGVTEYPGLDEKDLGNEMDPKEYRQLSENMSERLVWRSLLTIYQRFYGDSVVANYNGEALLKQMKHIMSTRPAWPVKSRRLTFGAGLPVDYCDVGNCGRYHVQGDSWVLTDEIARDRRPNLGGHEMVIYGFDDNAVAYDENGKAHQGLLRLRNSWGENAGDKGDFYMSYDYFKKFVWEVQVIESV